ncbi:hypothetical protein HNR06_000389 [Nocardiopsis arvandica]|uniref:GmrSD restriction endonucleases C-terminal domain-containing protein n=1 Tax=Nocardiopsis sinuspersici TaxID=501010 RepID=A0A7Y9X9R6_9ACTN|nr:HNH endonuclease family protein [Nocardiopsis sinuspersici]NYH50800.1 hypothetical protein [Nocardiopsis sinuspersici]
MPKKAPSKIGGVALTVFGVLALAACTLDQQGGTAQPQGDDTSSKPSTDGSSLSVEQARERLEELRVEAENDPSGYDRSLFPHWTSKDGCDTRQVVLQRDGEGVEVDEDCDPVAGSWHSPYDGETFTDSGDLDIDHMVALNEGWRSGAHAWTTEKRERFANDLDSSQLWAVSASSNRSKGDSDPADWLPPLESSHCDYVVSWIEVKHTWDLTVDPDEEAALREVLADC